MKKLLESLLYIACTIPRSEFNKCFSVYIFPKDGSYIMAPSGKLTYYNPIDYIELPDHTHNKDCFLVALLNAYWNSDQLIEIGKKYLAH